MQEESKLTINSLSSIEDKQNHKNVWLNESLSRDYKELTVSSSAHIIFPKNLPIKITIAGVRTIVHVGEFAIIPPNCVFAINSSPERYCIDFDFDIIKNNFDFRLLHPILIKPCVYHPINTEQHPNIGYTTWYTLITTASQADTNTYLKHESFISPITIVKEIASMLDSNKLQFTDAYNSGKILELYSILGDELVFSGFKGKPKTTAASDVIKNLTNSINYILYNFKSELTLEDVANVAGYSRSHYSKLFKEFYGISFYDYLLSLRVHCAALLLAHAEMSVTEIGSFSGFSSSSTLNRVFKQETGFSPRDYRKMFFQPSSEQSDFI